LKSLFFTEDSNSSSYAMLLL